MRHAHRFFALTLGLLALAPVANLRAEPAALRAFAAFSAPARATLQPLPDAALDQVRGQGWTATSTSTITASLTTCLGGSCNVQSVTQTNTNPNGTNSVTIQQSISR